MTESIFSNLDALRLSPNAGLGAVQEVLSHVAVRKPDRAEFFRLNGAPFMDLTTSVFRDKQERETFLVVPAMRAALMGEARPVMLRLCMNSVSVPFIWPISLPDETGRSNPWIETAIKASNCAQTYWTRMVPDMSLGAYRIYKAEGQLPDPEWPDKSLSELLTIAFRDRIIDHEDHPVVRRLRGLT